MANYGDVALNLSANWNRREQNDQNYTLMTVGHADGVADAYLSDEPDQEHQFAWVDTRYKDDIAINRTKGYTFVHKDTWTKNENLWEWDAEGFLVFKTYRLMARTKEEFLKDMADRRAQRDRVMGKSKDEEEAERIAALAGIALTGEGTKKTPRRGMRAN